MSTQRKPRKAHSVTSELAALSDKFGSIYTEVQEAVTKEYSEQEDVLQGVEDHITRLQMALMAEQHRRVVQLKTVESNLATLYNSIQVQCHAQLEALRPDVSTRVAAWHERLDDAFRMLDDACPNSQVLRVFTHDLKNRKPVGVSRMSIGSVPNLLRGR